MPVPSPCEAAESAWARSGQNCLAYIASAVAARMSSPLTAARPSGTGMASRLAWSTSASKAACGSVPPKLQNDLVDRARGEEPRDRALEARRLLAQVGRRRVDVAIGVDRAVEHHRPVVVREEARVGGAQEGAVREAEVVQLLVAHRGPDAVHVARHVGGRDEREDALVEAHAALDVGLVLGQERLDVQVLGRDERLRVEAVRLLVHGAVDRRRALADAARVEGDEVEVVVDRAEQERADRLSRVDRGAAGAAVVDEERARAVRLILRRQARDCDLDGAGARVAVVLRGLERRALPTRCSRIRVRARSPSSVRPGGEPAMAGTAIASSASAAPAAISARGNNRLLMCPPSASRHPSGACCNTLKRAMHPIHHGRRALGVFTPEDRRGKQPKSDTNDRSRPVSTGVCRRRRGRRTAAAPPTRAIYADSFTNRPMRAYFSGLRARTRYAYPIESTGTATPMMPSHETGTAYQLEPIVNSSLT